MSNNQLALPNLRKGCEIYVSRPFSLTLALIAAVVICVVSFLLLTFPVIAGYYYAVRESRREEYFIDLNNVLRTTFFVFKGIRKYFIRSYVFGLLGFLPTFVLYFVPLIPYYRSGEEGIYLGAILQILWLPAFFLAGAMVLYGYPCLVATNNAIGSIRYALSAGKSKRLKMIAVGFVLLFPIPGIVFHLLMIFSYPLIVSWAVAATADTTESLIEIKWKKSEVSPGVLLPLFLLAVAGSGGLFFFRIWEGPGIVAWVGMCLAFLFVRLFTNWGFALSLFGFVLGFVTALLGGGILFARLLGEEFYFLWVVICLLFLVLFQKRIFDRISSHWGPRR
jgi:hypothetical protein